MNLGLSKYNLVHIAQMVCQDVTVFALVIVTDNGIPLWSVAVESIPANILLGFEINNINE